MTRPDLKMFDLLRQNVFLKLPVHLYMVFLVNCETAKNPMGVDNITEVAERVHHELIGGILWSSLPWFRRIVEFPLSSCAPAVPQTLDHTVWIQCSLHTTKD